MVTRSLKLTRHRLKFLIQSGIQWGSDSIITYSHPKLGKDLRCIWDRSTPCHRITASRTSTSLVLVRLSEPGCLWCWSGMWSSQTGALFGLSLVLLLLSFYLLSCVSMDPGASLETKHHPVPTSHFPFCSHVPTERALLSKDSPFAAIPLLP